MLFSFFVIEQRAGSRVHPCADAEHAFENLLPGGNSVARLELIEALEDVVA
jgi:hypothetical protein